MKTEEILNEDELYRRFLDVWLKDDGSISSAAFQNTSHTDEMSVDLARLTTPEKTVSQYPTCGVAGFLAGLARKLEQRVLHDPIPGNIAHSKVKGQKTKGIRKKLAKGSTVVLPPPRWQGK
ncbi:hypothetical protein KA005_08960 [bacterium]|nr:hypothetical protein [bacterium]